ncbi:MAG: hypothetical protein PHU70_02060 [Dehalococcoidia bacterium]|nr:hypothetical protein [Dehalococcoidia bacterium]
MLKELIILGCGPTHAECRYDKEVWGVNGTYTFAPRMDKLFMTDGPDQVMEDIPNVAIIKSLGCPLILAERFPEVTPAFEKAGISVLRFPIEAVLAKFPTRFFSNSLAYMIALALQMTTTVQEPGDLRPRVIDGYHKIYLYGIDMMTNSTYIQEKGGVEFWMGVAFGLGVEIINTRGSATGKTYNGLMYGWYGQQEAKKVREQVFAPWEVVRTAKGDDQVLKHAINSEYVLQDNGDYIKQPIKRN